MTHEKTPQEFLPAGDRITIFLRGKTWYYNLQYDGQQIRRSLKTRSKREAIQRAQRIESGLKNSTVEPPRESTIKEACEAFLLAARGQNRAKRTLTQYTHITTLVQEQAEQRQLTDVSQLDARFADTWQLALTNDGQSRKTIYNKMIVLRSLTLFAYRRKMATNDPLAAYKLKKPKPTPQPCWSPAEADRIAATVTEHFRPYCLFLRDTGCRAGEAKFLTWDDVDFEKSQIHIREKEGWRPKSGDQRRVPLSPRLKATLEKLPRLSRWVFTAKTTAKFPQPGRQISERRALQAVKRAVSRLKLSGHLHTFRHSFISQALTQGVPEAVVRDWVGHVDPSVIRLYTHISDETSQKFLKAFSQDGTI